MIDFISYTKTEEEGKYLLEWRRDNKEYMVLLYEGLVIKDDHARESKIVAINNQKVMFDICGKVRSFHATDLAPLLDDLRTWSDNWKVIVEKPVKPTGRLNAIQGAKSGGCLPKPKELMP